MRPSELCHWRLARQFEPPAPYAPAMAEAPQILLNPEPGRWPALLAGPAAPSQFDRARFRAQMGLPIDRPLVLAGHQVAFWHPGILAKHFAAAALARAAGATSAWLWVDQDDNDPAQVPCPAGAGDGLRREAWDLAAARLEPQGVPVAMREVLRDIPEAPADLHAAARRDGPAEMRRTLAAHAGEPSMARQVAGAVGDLLAPLEPMPLQIFALDLARTDLFAELLARMHENARDCAEAYNRAVEAHPAGGIRPLTVREGRVELPLWRVRWGEPRLPVYSTTVAEIPAEELAPRALLMDGIIRLAGCDLFIHGTGGGDYAPVTEAWFEGWLGERPAPVAIASATLRLPLAEGDLPTEEEIREAKDLAHKARHDPSLLNDKPAAEAKGELLAKIEVAKQSGENPAPLFEQMQTLLDEYRARRAADLRELEERAERLAARRGLAEIAADRTWPFPLYEPERLSALREQIEAAFTTGGRR